MVKIDWAFTEDGDLALGDPKVNAEGQVLYKHMNNQLDTEMGEDGRIVRDLMYVENLEAEKQVILNRLRTDAPDWYHHPGMGGNLSDLIGEPNTRETGNMGAEFVERALTYKRLYDVRDINVRPVPISAETIIFMIEITKQDKVVRLPVSFNLEHGLIDYYEVPQVD